jgi:uncharacterized protein (DUF58 family)
VVVGLLGPALFLRRVRCWVAENPADAVAGASVEVTVAASSPVVVRPIDPPGPPRPTGQPRQCVLTVTPPFRGELGTCTLELASAAPFGLLWWTKRVTVPLPRPLCVAPPLGSATRAERHVDDEVGDEGHTIHRRVGEPRGVRDYQPGDLRSWVHWRATAHTGTLMVREMEGPTAQPVTVNGVLPDDPDRADEAASQVLGEVASQLAAGRAVVLVTVEPEGEQRRPVTGVLDAGRRLGRALPQRSRGATR